MFYNFEGAAKGLGYSILAATITPRPIAWITSSNAEGRVNLAPFSFFNAMGGTPPTLAVGFLAGPNGWKDTATNIREGFEFVVHLVSESFAEAMNASSADYPADVSEPEVLGLELVASTELRVPRLAKADIAFECRLVSFVETGSFQGVAIAQVLGAHISERVLRDEARGTVDRAALSLISRLDGRGNYGRNPEIFEMARPAKPTAF